MNWISWIDFPPPDDIRGILIKYDDGIFSDRYDEKGKRKFREGKEIIGWKFMERRDPSKRTIQCTKCLIKEIKEFIKESDERFKIF